MQIDPDLRPLVCLRIGVIFLHKKLRPGQAETVDALLHVPHHEHIGDALPAAYAVQNNLLNQVTVLIFVDHNLCVPGGQLPRRVRGHNLKPAILSGLHILHQNLQCQMLQIRKIRQIFQPLLLLIPIREFRRQRKQYLRGRRGFPNNLLHARQRQVKKLLLQILQTLFHALPEGFDLVLPLFLHIRILLRGKPREGKALQPLPDLLIAPAGFQLLHLN